MSNLQRCWKLILMLFAAILIIVLMNYSLDHALSYKQVVAYWTQLQLQSQDNQTFESGFGLKSSIEVKNFTKPYNTTVNPKNKTNVTMKKKEKKKRGRFQIDWDKPGLHNGYRHPVCQTFLSKKQKAEKNDHNINMNVASESIDNTVIYKRYPGLTFLPNYKLQRFINQDNITSLDRLLKNITQSEAELRFHSLVNTLHVNCTKYMRRMGNTGDEGWDICIPGPYNPKSNCLVYSFGINKDFSFDDAMGKQYRCIVKAFDPSMRVGITCAPIKYGFIK